MNALYGCRAVHDGPVCLRSDRWSRQAVCSSCTKGIRHGIEIGRRPASAPADGVLLALTFGTLLSSQGAGAHRYRTSRSVSGQLAKHYSAGFAVSNPEVCRRTTRPSLLAAESAGSEGWSPSRRRSTGVRGVEHGRRAVAVESNPLPSLSGPRSGTIVDPRQRLGGARRHADGRARTRTEPTSTVIFSAS